MAERDSKAFTFMMKQLGSSVLFGIISILIVMVNKTVLTVHKYVITAYYKLFQLLPTLLSGLSGLFPSSVCDHNSHKLMFSAH